MDSVKTRTCPICDKVFTNTSVRDFHLNGNHHKEKPSILDEARKTLDERRESYGSPKNNLNVTAYLWRSWLHTKYGDKDKVPNLQGEDVAMMQILLKIAREANEHKRDNLVDICGYAACYQECIDE